MKLVLFLAALSSLVLTKEDNERMSKAKACLKNYGKLSAHNLKHIEIQKVMYKMTETIKQLKEHSPEDKEYAELKQQLEEDALILRKDKAVVEYLKSIKQNCNPEDEKLLQKLNVEQSEEVEKELEKAEENEKKAGRKNPKNLKMGARQVGRTIAGIGAFGLGIAISAIPTLIMFPICLVPSVIIILLTLASVIVIDKIERAQSDDDDDVSVAGLLSMIFMPLGATFGMVCMYPALYPAFYGHKVYKRLTNKSVEMF